MHDPNALPARRYILKATKAASFSYYTFLVSHHPIAVKTMEKRYQTNIEKSNKLAKAKLCSWLVVLPLRHGPLNDIPTFPRVLKEMPISAVVHVSSERVSKRVADGCSPRDALESLLESLILVLFFNTDCGNV